jgi:hypothetical protein
MGCIITGAGLVGWPEELAIMRVLQQERCTAARF